MMMRERMEKESRGLPWFSPFLFGMEPMPAQFRQGQHHHLTPAVPQQL